MNEKPIALITFDYPPQKGGVARYLKNLVDASEGKIEAITSNEEKFFRGAWPRWRPLVSVCRERLKTQIVLISHVFPVGTAVWIASWFSRGKYAIIFHGLDVRLARGVWKTFLLNRICSGAVALIANSEATKKDLLKLKPNANVIVITPGVEKNNFLSRGQARARLGLSDDEKIVLSVARLVPRKGIDNAIRAMAKIQSKESAKYVVIGDGEDRGRLENVAREAKANVLWLANPSDDLKREWLSASDLFLLPVRDEGDDVEGFGIAFLEASQAGLPIVAGRSGGVPEAVLDGKTGILVDPLNIDEITQNVAKCLANPELRSLYGWNGKERVKNDFNWSERWDRLAGLLKIPR